MLHWFQVYNNMVQLHIYMYLFFFLEKEMATHSSTLAWKILWAEEPDRYSPWGSKESDTTERLHSPIRLLQNIEQSPLCYILVGYPF